jgi:hypothetical protein
MRGVPTNYTLNRTAPPDTVMPWAGAADRRCLSVDDGGFNDGT